jgi:aryl-alcohol dehydrogenase-like predicted oxidoreductase
MRYRELGSTGLEVSVLCLGTWELSGDWGADHEDAVAAVRTAFDLGITFFDTAYAYGEGAAEAGLARGLGELMRTHRDELVISTKGGVEADVSRGTGFGEKRLVRNSDPKFLRQNLETSLRTLGTDYVDIYFVHWPDPTVPFEDAAAALEGFVDEGLVRHAGVSNFTVAQMDAYTAGGRVEVAQVPYNLFDRGVEEEILPWCERHGAGVMGYAGLARGALSGTLRGGQTFPDDDWRAVHPAFQGERFDALMEAVDRLSAEAASRNDCGLAQLALAWVMSHPLGIVPIVGAQLPEHIQDSARAADVELTPEERDELSRLELVVPAFGSGGNIGVRA